MRRAPATPAPGAIGARSNAKPPPGSTGTTPAAPTSLWAASHHNKQKTNAQQHERKRPQQASTKPRTRQTARGPLHPLRGAAPVMWRCTRYVALHPLRGDTPEQKGCNAYGSGALPLGTSESVVSVGHGMVVEVGLNNRRRASGVLLRYRRCVWTGVQGTSHWRCTRYVALHPLCGAAPEQKGCNAYRSGAAHPITRTNAESARRPPPRRRCVKEQNVLVL